MKSVLISIQPHWCELIASGGKTSEVRKTMPKLATPFKCYIYCTKDRPFLNSRNCMVYLSEKDILGGLGPGLYQRLNGRVIGEFVCDNILSIGRRGVNNNFDYCYESLNTFGNDDIEPYIRAIRESCVGKNELHEYAKDNPSLYGWHISDLVIYDKPKELSVFWQIINNGNRKYLIRPPQSWCYVEEV